MKERTWSWTFSYSFSEPVLSLETSACPVKLDSAVLSSERVSTKITGVSQVQLFDIYNKHVPSKAEVIGSSRSLRLFPSGRHFRAAAARTKRTEILFSIAVC